MLKAKDRIRRLENENARLRNENEQLKAVTDYIAVCDHPEILEEEEEEINE